MVELTHARAILAAAALLAASAAAAHQPQPPSAPPTATAPAIDVPIPDLNGRLAALSPDNPRAYFLLAEEIAAELSTANTPPRPGASAAPGQSDDPEAPARRLAQHLLVLAYELDQRLPEPTRLNLGRSVCLALASIADREPDRRWLAALARGLDPRAANRAAIGSPLIEAPPESTALDLCTAIGYARSGEGRRAEQLLERPGVNQLLDRYDAMLHPAGISGGAATVRKAIAQWPVCPECRNARIVIRHGEGGGTKIMCRTCNGNPGPRLSNSELLMQLRLESALLSGIHRSWGAQAVADRGTPLRDLDPAELAPTFGVDPNKPLWRDGQWVADPAALPEPSPPPAADAPAPEPDPAESPASSMSG